MPVHCHLVVPGLFLPAEQAEAYRGLVLPSLQTLLARADSSHTPPQNLEAWLGKAFGIEPQQNVPVAPLTLAFDGGMPGNDYWLRADPVHLRLHRDQGSLIDASIATLTQPEAEALCVTLNHQFAGEGLAFLPLQPDRWYVKLAHIPAMQTVALHAAIGKDIHPLLPSGTDAAGWRQRLNEIQMLLFEHPTNTERESRGELPINSVWFWGGGMMPKNIAIAYSSVSSDDLFTRGLARAADIPESSLPDNGHAWLKQEINNPQNTYKKLLIINKLNKHLSYGDLYHWRESLLALEHQWFAPLLTALRSGEIASLTISTPDEQGSREFVVSKNSLRKFWRRPKPLESFHD
jgi:hypothetical protein